MGNQEVKCIQHGVMTDRRCVVCRKTAICEKCERWNIGWGKPASNDDSFIACESCVRAAMTTGSPIQPCHICSDQKLTSPGATEHALHIHSKCMVCTRYVCWQCRRYDICTCKNQTAAIVCARCEPPAQPKTECCGKWRCGNCSARWSIFDRALLLPFYSVNPVNPHAPCAACKRLLCKDCATTCRHCPRIICGLGGCASSGLEHKVKCGHCGDSGASACSRMLPCPVCKKKRLCEECFGRLANCFVCKSPVSACDGLGQVQVCAKCTRTTCRAQYLDSTKDAKTSSCAVTCSGCHVSLCRSCYDEHRPRCGSCGDVVDGAQCKLHCGECGAPTCSSCRRSCPGHPHSSSCPNCYVRLHRYTCCACGRGNAADCAGRCKGTGCTMAWCEACLQLNHARETTALNTTMTKSAHQKSKGTRGKNEDDEQKQDTNSWNCTCCFGAKYCHSCAKKHATPCSSPGCHELMCHQIRRCDQHLITNAHNGGKRERNKFKCNKCGSGMHLRKLTVHCSQQGCSRASTEMQCCWHLARSTQQDRFMVLCAHCSQWRCKDHARKCGCCCASSQTVCLGCSCPPCALLLQSWVTAGCRDTSQIILDYLYEPVPWL